MKKITRFLILLISVSLLLSCSKSSTEPDEKKTDTGGSGVPETQTGAGTMGALIDGVAWKNTTAGTAGSVSAGLTIVVGLSAVSDLTTVTSHTFTFTIRANAVGTYPLAVIGGTSNYANYTKTVAPIANPGSAVTTTYFTGLNAGTFTITKFDATSKIVSGTFNFNASSIGDNPKTVAITAGVFDVKY